MRKAERRWLKAEVGDDGQVAGDGRRGKTVMRKLAGQTVPETLDLSLSQLRRPGVIYYDIGPGSFVVQRFLGTLTGDKFLLTPPPRSSPGQPGFPRRVDKYDMVT